MPAGKSNEAPAIPELAANYTQGHPYLAHAVATTIIVAPVLEALMPLSHDKKAPIDLQAVIATLNKRMSEHPCYTTFHVSDGNFFSFQSSLLIGSKMHTLSIVKGSDQIEGLERFTEAVFNDLLEEPSLTPKEKRQLEENRSEILSAEYHGKFTEIFTLSGRTRNQSATATWVVDLNRTPFEKEYVRLNGYNFMVTSVITGRVTDELKNSTSDLGSVVATQLIAASFSTGMSGFQEKAKKLFESLPQGNRASTLNLDFSPAPREAFLKGLLRGATKAAMTRGLFKESDLRKNGIVLTDKSDTLSEKDREQAKYIGFEFSFDDKQQPIDAALAYVAAVDKAIAYDDQFVSTVERQSIMAFCDDFTKLSTELGSPQASRAVSDQLAKIKATIMSTLELGESGAVSSSKTLSKDEQEALSQAITTFHALNHERAQLSNLMLTQQKAQELQNSSSTSECPAVKAMAAEFSAVDSEIGALLQEKLSANSGADSMAKFNALDTMHRALSTESPRLAGKCDDATAELTKTAEQEAQTHPTLKGLAESLAAEFNQLKQDIADTLQNNTAAEALPDYQAEFEALNKRKRSLLNPIRQQKKAQKLTQKLAPFTDIAKKTKLAAHFNELATTAEALDKAYENALKTNLTQLTQTYTLDSIIDTATAQSKSITPSFRDATKTKVKSIVISAAQERLFSLAEQLTTCEQNVTAIVPIFSTIQTCDEKIEALKESMAAALEEAGSSGATYTPVVTRMNALATSFKKMKEQAMAITSDTGSATIQRDFSALQKEHNQFNSDVAASKTHTRKANELEQNINAGSPLPEALGRSAKRHRALANEHYQRAITPPPSPTASDGDVSDSDSTSSSEEEAKALQDNARQNEAKALEKTEQTIQKGESIIKQCDTARVAIRALDDSKEARFYRHLPDKYKALKQRIVAGIEQKHPATDVAAFQANLDELNAEKAATEQHLTILEGCDLADKDLEKLEPSTLATKDLIKAYETLKVEASVADIDKCQQRFDDLQETKETLQKFITAYSSAGEKIRDPNFSFARNDLSEMQNYIKSQLNAGLHIVMTRVTLMLSKAQTIEELIADGATEQRKNNTNRVIGIALSASVVPLAAGGALAAAFFLPALVAAGALTATGFGAILGAIIVVGLIAAAIGITMAHIPRPASKPAPKLAKEKAKGPAVTAKANRPTAVSTDSEGSSASTDSGDSKDEQKGAAADPLEQKEDKTSNGATPNDDEEEGFSPPRRM